MKYTYCVSGRHIGRDDFWKELQRVKWSYASQDMVALKRLEQRIATTGRRQDLISYSDLVKGIQFKMNNVQQGQSYEIDIADWQPLDRAIIGDFLGCISSRSYGTAKFMASALVINQLEGRPSEHFFNWMIEIGAMSSRTESAKLEFWAKEVNKAHSWYTKH